MFILYIIFYILVLYIIYKLKYKKTIYISIEGNIGSGKTTLLNLLKKKYTNIVFLDEPVNKWININDSNNNNILDNFYKDQKRWSYTFQNFAFITRITELIINKNKLINKTVISERSIDTDKNVFAELLFDNNHLSELEYNIYNYWFNILSKEVKKVDKIIYVNTKPKLCSERIKIRNRIEEQNIKLEYLEQLHKKHKLWLSNKSNILEIDGKNKFDDKTLNQIYYFIYK